MLVVKMINKQTTEQVMKQVLASDLLDKQIAAFGTVSVCAWCKKVKVGGSDVWVAVPPEQTKGVFPLISHGICPSCRAAMAADAGN